MKKKFLLLLCIIYLPFGNTKSGALSAQEKQGQARIDSLLHELNARASANARTDSAKVDLLNQISFSYRNINPDEGIKYGLQGLALAEKINLKQGIAQLNNALGVNNRLKSDFKKALQYFSNFIKDE